MFVVIMFDPSFNALSFKIINVCYSAFIGCKRQDLSFFANDSLL